MKPSTVIVLGGSGFVGRNLVRHLRSNIDFVVHAPPRTELDVTDFKAAAMYLRAVKPEIVVNCAAATGIGSVEALRSTAEMLNVTVPTRWAGLASEVGARFVHFSTDQVFSGAQLRPHREEDGVGPLSTYGQTKQRGENAVLGCATHLVVRTSFVFGADGTTFMSRLPRLLAAAQPLKIVTGLRASCTSIDSLCSGVIALLRGNASGLFHVANRGETSWAAFAECCRETMAAFGHPVRCSGIDYVDYAAMQAALGPRALYSVLDVIKLEKFLGRAVPAWSDEISHFVRQSLGHAASTAERTA